MKISLKWLNDYVDVTDYFSKPDELADVLTRAGLEVEEIKDLGRELGQVVVGLIQEKGQHPNADKLSLCRVEVGPGKIESIVCGAQNHRTGDKVVVALPGAQLPGGLNIKKSKIREVESNGMLCSFKEIGQAGGGDGIIILDPQAPIGEPYAKYAGLDDVTFELKVTPNRADCLSHHGLARELGCLLNREVKKFETASGFSERSSKDKIGLDVQASGLCIRYSGRYLADVQIKPSPDWLKRRLESIGLNSINNIVDVTNYVMLELGQPLHAFDADLLNGSKITVRKAKKNEFFKTLKEEDLTLNGEELVICDDAKAIALAGVIGGFDSGINERTKNIFIESANFDSMNVRKSSRIHGIETDSAYRFSRGVDPSQTVEAMDRAVLLIQKVAGGEAYADHHDFYPQAVTKKPITISLETISKRLGYAAEASLFEQFMKGLQCQITSTLAGRYTIIPPSFRFDIEQEMDLVEEYARLNGYDKIQETLPAFKKSPLGHDAVYNLKNLLSVNLRASGFSQAFNYAFTSRKDESHFIGDVDLLRKTGLPTNAQSVSIKNPLSGELDGMRRLATFSVWKNVRENFHMGNQHGQVFEIGPVFAKVENGYKESQRLSLTSWGEDFGLYAQSTPRVFRLRSAIEKLFSSLSISAYAFKNISAPPSFLHHGQCAVIMVEGKSVGFIGTVHPQLVADEKLRVDVALAELDLDVLFQGQPRAQKFKSVSTYQVVERDFSFVMDAGVPVGDMLAEIKKSVGSVCKDVSVFDVYQGDKLDSHLKSVSLRVSLQDSSQEMNEPAIQEAVGKIVATASKSTGAKLR